MSVCMQVWNKEMTAKLLIQVVVVLLVLGTLLDLASMLSIPFLVGLGDSCVGTVVSSKHVLTSGVCEQGSLATFRTGQSYQIVKEKLSGDKRLKMLLMNDTIRLTVQPNMSALYLSTAYVDTTQCYFTSGQIHNAGFYKGHFEECAHDSTGPTLAAQGCSPTDDCSRQTLTGSPVFCKMNNDEFTQFGVFIERQCSGSSGTEQAAFVRFYSLWILSCIKNDLSN